MRLVLTVVLAAAVLIWPAQADPLTVLTASRRDRVSGRPGRSVVRPGWRRRTPVVTPDDVLALLEGLAPALKVGLTPAEALALVVRTNLGRQAPEPGPAQPGGAGGARGQQVRGGTWQEQLASVGQMAREGLLLAPIWRELAEHHHSAELLLLAQAWSLSERLGSALSDAVITATEMVRARLRQQRRVAAAAAGAKATMNLLTVLPLGGIGVALMVGISPAALYLRSPAAIGCLAIGLLLLVSGRWVVRRLVRRSLEPMAIV